MKRFGLLGKTLSHSFSKKYFTEKFEKLGLSDHRYELFEIPQISDFPTLIAQNAPLSGMNVTIPYKELVMPFLDNLDISAQKVGAVNVIKFAESGKLIGYNSDYYGFKNSLVNSLKHYDLDMPKAGLVLGTGGASKAVFAALNDLAIDCKIVSRDSSKADFSYDDLHELQINNAMLIVNASPLGTYPNIKEFPAIPYHLLTEKHLLFDLVYNPEITTFMKKGLEKGAKTVNGLEMLHLQAEKAWDIWNA
jgi:shikimate dehydrogenase